MKEVIITTQQNIIKRAMMSDEEYQKLEEISDRMNLDWNFHSTNFPSDKQPEELTTNQLISRLKPKNYKFNS